MGPPLPRLPVLTSNQSTDIAVIGAGYTGLSAALHLSRNNVDVTLLEGKEIGFGGSGRNVGLVNAGLWVFPDDIVKTLGDEYGEQLISTLSASPDLVFQRDRDIEYREYRDDRHSNCLLLSLPP